LVAATALVMCASLMLAINHTANSIDRMQVDEHAVRASFALAVAVREQYIHLAHEMIEGPETHFEHYEPWVERVRLSGQELVKQAPRAGATVERTIGASRALDSLFRDEVQPALRNDDPQTLRVLHRRAERISAKAMADADSVAEGIERQMARHHTVAKAATQAGMLSGGLCIGAVLLLSGLYTRRLQRSLIAPLDVLTRAAHRIGRGELSSKLGPIGEGELRALAEAFDRMGAELAERQRQLLRSERMAVVGQFAAGVAHEINNPIGVIRGYLRTMSPDDPRDQRAEELAILEEEARACQRIADDLLTYVRAPQLARTEVRMDELLAESVRRLVESEEAGVLQADLDVSPGTLQGDPGRLRQVVLNLLRNAAAMSPRGSAIQVTGEPTDTGGYVFSVNDRGPGISSDDRERIFEPFFSKRGGSGLGLAVCQGVIAAHGGTIEVSDRDGGGTAFIVTLPPAPEPEGTI
jgi:signal transduction histidine kinase